MFQPARPCPFVHHPSASPQPLFLVSIRPVRRASEKARQYAIAAMPSQRRRQLAIVRIQCVWKMRRVQKMVRDMRQRKSQVRPYMCRGCGKAPHPLARTSCFLRDAQGWRLLPLGVHFWMAQGLSIPGPPQTPVAMVLRCICVPGQHCLGPGHAGCSQHSVWANPQRHVFWESPGVCSAAV